ncbi:MAG: DNA repair ATPase, partial [Planctomycetota bacterium]
MTEQLATGTYEVLRNRLRDAAKDLRGRFEQLNAARADVFGNIETKLGSTAHVSTDHNCVPRDLHAIGDQVLLGYNVQFGLKTDIALEDVFSLYRLDDDVAHPIALDALFDERFRRDFSELYRYYKNTTFSRFFVSGPNLYFVFQVGKSAQDIKAFKWAVQGDSLEYLDNRSDHEVRLPPQHAFQWKRATRDQHRSGLHPHISIDDIVFVECVGGDLTIKVEDNTEDGSGIYAEPVENPDQTLDDAEIFYCILGNLVLLRMRPYQEKEFRHLVFSAKQQKAMRLDGIERSCVLLPDDQGIIFPTGFVLQTGENKLFDHGFEDLHFDRMIAAQNGEDFLYLFTDLDSGTYLHLRYNLIKQEVDTPLICHGQALFDDGQMITFRGQESAAKHHALQLWQTPYVGPNYQSAVETDSMLYKIGNRELVRGMAECQEVLHLIDRDDSYEALYVDLVKRSTDILDSYFWLDRED